MHYLHFNNWTRPETFMQLLSHISFNLLKQSLPVVNDAIMFLKADYKDSLVTFVYADQAIL